MAQCGQKAGENAIWTMGKGHERFAGGELPLPKVAVLKSKGYYIEPLAYDKLLRLLL